MTNETKQQIAHNYAISCIDCDVHNVYADPSEFYDVASRIIKGWEG